MNNISIRPRRALAAVAVGAIALASSLALAAPANAWKDTDSTGTPGRVDMVRTHAEGLNLGEVGELYEFSSKGAFVGRSASTIVGAGARQYVKVTATLEKLEVKLIWTDSGVKYIPVAVPIKSGTIKVSISESRSGVRLPEQSFRGGVPAAPDASGITRGQKYRLTYKLTWSIKTKRELRDVTLGTVKVVPTRGADGYCSTAYPTPPLFPCSVDSAGWIMWPLP